MFGNCTILNKINQVKQLATQTEITLFLIQKINLISCLDFSTESTDSAHIVPAKTTAGDSDVPPNLQVELAAVKREHSVGQPPYMQQLTAFLVHRPHDSSAGKYSVARGSTKDQWRKQRHPHWCPPLRIKWQLCGVDPGAVHWGRRYRFLRHSYKEASTRGARRCHHHLTVVWHANVEAFLKAAVLAFIAGFLVNATVKITVIIDQL